MKKENQIKEKFIYDRTIREIFQKIPKTFIKLLTNKEAVELLETKFPKVEEKQADLVVRLEDNSIFHLELQLSDDKEMPNRMLYYALLIQNKHKIFPKQMVLYLGDKKINTPNFIKNERLFFEYEIRYIKDLECEVLIESEDINDNILAILCNVKDINRLLRRLKEKLDRLSEKKREDYIRKLLYLIRLRPNFYDIIDEDIRKEIGMSYIIDKENDPFFKEGIKRGIDIGKKKGLKEGMEKGLKQGIEKGIVIGRLEGEKRGMEKGIVVGKLKGEREGKLKSAYIMVRRYNIPISKIAMDFGIDEEELKEYIRKVWS